MNEQNLFKVNFELINLQSEKYIQYNLMNTNSDKVNNL